MQKYFVKFILIFFISTKLYSTEVTCVHRQVCNLLYALKISSIHITPITFNGNDPHQARLKISQIKKILKAPFVFLPPHKLIPTLKKLHLKNKYYFLNESIDDHFWLDQKNICQAKNQILKKLKEWSIISRQEKINCRKIKVKINFSKIAHIKLIVLSHHALLNLFKNKFKVIILSSEHGKVNLNISDLKQIITYLKSSQVLFIEEKQIPLPDLPFKNLLNKQNHLFLDSLGKLKSPPAEVLTNIQVKLRSL